MTIIQQETRKYQELLFTLLGMIKMWLMGEKKKRVLSIKHAYEMVTTSRISTNILGRHKERRKENRGKVRGIVINVTRLAKI